MRTALSAILALGTASAVWAAGPDPESRTYSRSCGIVVSSTPSVERVSRVPRFSSREILDVTFEVVFRPRHPTPAPDSLELRLYTPNGFLYRRSTVPIGAQGPPERERALPGWLERRPAVGVAAPPLLVAGTDVMLNSLYGRWRAEAWAPGERRACAAAFEILP